MRNRIAVFDLDETIIRQKSMLSVVRQYFELGSDIEKSRDVGFTDFMDHISKFVESNEGRQQQNRYFYHLMSGFERQRIRRAAEAWFLREKYAIYNDAVVAELKRHRDNGTLIVVVTGSFFDAVLPIKNDLGIDYVLCVNQEIENGCYTGRIFGSPVIGVGKAEALASFVKEHQVNMKDSYGYGDHISDVAMLELVDHPCAVGNSVELKKLAVSRGWQCLDF
ncbi:HAD family hydrolase [Undibacterium sp. Dicai25W]|uniref:HAD family hydrolase n=1 Tax=Undibacterium sp. Dicai25W TaxID=3413034 RepID=UPI003BF32EFD